VPDLSPATVAALMEVVDSGYAHRDLDVLFVRLGARGADPHDPDGRMNKMQRIVPLMETLGTSHEEPNLITLLREVIEEKYRNVVRDRNGEPRTRELGRLLDAMRRDGYEVVDGLLTATTPGATALSVEITALERELEARGLTVALEHYRQAERSFVDDRLEASNGQLRSFLDDLAQSLAESSTGRRPSDAKSAADVLRSNNVIDGDEANLLKGLAGVSNQRGAHAGLTDPDEALFRLHMATAFARYLLARIT
jgi:hypothetical protein